MRWQPTDKILFPKPVMCLSNMGEVENWTVYENQTRGDCLIVRDYGASSVQMGVTADQQVGYLGVFSKDDIGLQNGTKSEVFVSIGVISMVVLPPAPTASSRADILAATS